jgi:polyhydroxyalkanoate synthesis regulator phasin
MTSLRKRVTVGIVGAAVLVGGGIAYAASQSSDPRDAYLNDVAKRLNVTPEKLRDAMKGASLDQLEQAVKDGNLTQEQADRMKQRIEAGAGAGPILGMPGRIERHEFGGGFAFKAVGGVLDDVAKELGISAADLRKQLVSGKSLADIAKAKGKSVDDIKKTVTSAATSHLDKAVKDGDLTQKQADAIRSKLAAHIDELLTASPPRIAGRAFKGGPVPVPGFAPGPRGHGFGFGRMAFGADIEAVANYLGLSRAALHKQIAAGKSLTDIAKAQGKSVDGLKKAVSARARKRLDEAVKDGHLTKAQADDMAAKLDEHLDELMSMSLPRWKHP